MLGRKRAHPEADSSNPEVRFRNTMRTLVSENALASNTVQQIIDSTRAMAPGSLSDLPKQRMTSVSNAARDLARAFLRGNRWPHVYWARISTTDVRTGTERPSWMAFGLPHEYLLSLSRNGSDQVLRDRSGMDPLTLQPLQSCESQANAVLVALGLWGDGVPVQWERKESIQTLSMNLPGLSGSHRNLRLPLLAFSKKHCSQHTWEDINSVLAWSFRHCALGSWPTERHDGSPWLQSDHAKRRGQVARSTQQSVTVRASLCEIRADWPFLAELFRFPTHNYQGGHCWQCCATPTEAALIFVALYI